MSKLTNKLDKRREKPLSKQEKALREVAEWYVAEERAGNKLLSSGELAEILAEEGHTVSSATILRRIKEARKHASS
jgi:hypothetical protein